METPATPGTPDYAGAIAYALERLHKELPAILSYHTPWHTEGDVLPAVRRLAALAGVSGMELGLLEVGAAFHDMGYIRTFHGHEILSVEFMADALPGFGFDAAAIARVAGLINTTRMPQCPHNDLECLLADADLDVLGREDFFTTSIALWREQVALGLGVAWPDWLKSQLKFLRGHNYFTPYARELRNAGKARNAARLEAMIRDAAPPPEPA